MVAAQPEIENRWVPFHEAARRLHLSRAQLADTVLWHGIPVERDGDLWLQSEDVERLAATLGSDDLVPGTRTSPLPSALDRAVWLLSDWGGRARVRDLAIGLGVGSSAASQALKELRGRGYVDRSGNDPAYQLTEQGRGHVAKERRPM